MSPHTAILRGTFPATMSEQPNSTPPGNNANRGPGDANGFNWRLLILLSVAMLILGAAFFGPAINKNATAISYSEFRKAWDQGRVIIDQPEKPLIMALREQPNLQSSWFVPNGPDGGLYYFKFFARYNVFYGDWRLAVRGQ